MQNLQLPLSSHRRNVLVIVAVACLAYANTLANGFVYDDLITIVNNPFVHDLGNLGRYFAADFPDKQRPFLVLTTFVDVAIWGLAPFGHHVQNILWHALAAALVYALIVSMGQERTVAMLAALFFAVHPIQTEAVTGIAFREDVLATCFTLLVALCVLRWHASAARGRAAFYLAAAVLAYLLGLLSKESAVVAPALAALCLWLARREEPERWWRRAFVAGVVLALALVPYGFLNSAFPLYRWLAQLGHEAALPALPASGPGAGAPRLDFSVQLAVMARIFRDYVGLVVFPIRQSVEYVPDYRPFSAGSAVGLLFLAACVLVAWRLRDRRPLLTFGLVWFLVALISVSLPGFLYDPKAERFLYLPMVGAAALFGTGGAWLWRSAQTSRRAAIACRASLVAVLVLLAALTVRRNTVWHDQVSLWEDAVAKAPASARAHGALAKAYQARGRMDAAETGYRRALELDPGYAIARYNYGELLAALGRLDDATAQFRLAAEEKDTRDVRSVSGHAHLALAQIALKKSQREAAEEELEAALRDRPDFFEALNQLGLYYAQRASYTEAEAVFRRAVAANPRSALAYNNLATVLIKKGDLPGGRAELERVVALDPKNLVGWLNLGTLNLSLGDRGQAAICFRRALTIDPNSAAAREGLTASETNGLE